MTKKTDTNWQAIEDDFRTGSLSNRQIAKKHGIAESTLRKRITAGGWVRTSAKKVRKHPTTAHQPADHSEQLIAPPRERLGSTRNRSSVSLEERTEHLVSRLLGEVEDATAHLGEIAEVIELETADDTGPRRRDAMMKAISTKERAETVRTLRQILTMGDTAVSKKKGVKEQRKDAAERAMGGKFRPMRPPTLIINNGGS